MLDSENCSEVEATEGKKLSIFNSTAKLMPKPYGNVADDIQVIMTEDHEESDDSLTEYVVNLVKEQGVAVQFAIDSENIIDLNAMTPEEARRLISGNGYFGVEKTSGRILEFAMRTSGNDSARLADIKTAIKKGFQEAETVYGNKLPDISNDTLDMIMTKLDIWAEKSVTA